MTDSFPASSGKNSRLSRRNSRGGALNRKSERNPSVVPQFQGTPRCQSIPEELAFPALTLLSRRGSTHYTMERGSALWESLEGKPRGKATDPLIHAKGSATLLLEREERARACPHSRRGLTPLRRLQKYPKIHVTLERNPQVPAPTPHKALGPGIDGRGIPRPPGATRMGTGLS